MQLFDSFYFIEECTKMEWVQVSSTKTTHKCRKIQTNRYYKNYGRTFYQMRDSWRFSSTRSSMHGLRSWKIIFHLIEEEGARPSKDCVKTTKQSVAVAYSKKCVIQVPGVTLSRNKFMTFIAVKLIGCT